MELNEIIEISNRYGSNPEYVLAGGGNTSVKDKDFLYVKGSGTALATIGESGFVRMDRAKLNAVMSKTYVCAPDETEALVLADMMAARAPGEEAKRPSVEALLHSLFPQKLVLHLHPAMVNGLTCGRDGKIASIALFGGESVWLDEVRPGYTLAKAAKEAMDAYRADSYMDCHLLLLQNHGIFFAADSVAELDKLFERVMARIAESCPAEPDFSSAGSDREAAAAAAPAVRMLTRTDNGGAFTLFSDSKEALAMMRDPLFERLTTFTPDHMVYCRAGAVLVQNVDELPEKVAAFEARFGVKPRIVGIKELGVFACGATMKDARTAARLFDDAIKVAVYSRFFGGPRTQSDAMVEFIRNWEVESYRAKVASAGASAKGRLDGKIAIVTGGAQGFGEGIAIELCREGAHVVIADMNAEGAKVCAERLCSRFGEFAATFAAANVGDEASVKAMVESTVLAYGGLDMFVSNAGIVKSGGLEELDFKTFELMTKVNYSAYFLCVKYASRVMKLQNQYAPEYFTDIIQINSKSGLVGSNKNFAYAGGKFGGVGLTESFALELVPYNIKVNAICPGNFYEGPLWNDPEKGLFVQYLRSGKVPGAQTVADVRRFYEDKCPMRRGCNALDVARAIFYIVEQLYETGQAIPVTGGQVMLH